MSSSAELNDVPALELINLTRQRPGCDPVFSNLNMSVPSSGITVLLGPSGCGKSTLLRCAASLEPVEYGTVKFLGKEVREPSIQRQLILQDYNQLFPWLTVAENIMFPRSLGGSGKGRRAFGAKETENEKEPQSLGRSGQGCRSFTHSVERLLEMVNLKEAAGLYPAQLSGGMCQRAVLARALSAEPSLLLLDEPFAALDSHIRSRLQNLLIQIHKEEGTAMLLVTHNVSEALVLGDFIVCMDSNGRLASSISNPLGENRKPETPEFHSASIDLEKRYALLVNPVDF